MDNTLFLNFSSCGRCLGDNFPNRHLITCHFIHRDLQIFIFQHLLGYFHRLSFYIRNGNHLVAPEVAKAEKGPGKSSGKDNQQTAPDIFLWQIGYETGNLPFGITALDTPCLL